MTHPQTNATEYSVSLLTGDMSINLMESSDYRTFWRASFLHISEGSRYH